MKEARNMALKALDNDKCAKVFGGGSGLNPSEVLSSIIDGGKYGHVEYESHAPSATGDDWGAAQTTPNGLPNPLPPWRPHWSSVTITINTFQDPQSGVHWNDGHTAQNADTLLHELGHAMCFLGARGGKFKMNDRSDEAQKFNSNLLEENCWKPLRNTK